MVSDNERRQLFSVLQEHLGAEPAATMMELLPAGGGADLARKSDLMAFKAELLGEMAAPGSVETTAGAKIEVAALDKALQTLPEHYRAAVVLRDVYGFTTEEIATQLKISETAAKVRVHRGRKKLKEMMWGPNDA